jgi:oligopeptide/dipeptide ABC transporter ATP-binding protein
MQNLLEVENLHTCFFLPQGAVRAVSGVDLIVKEKEIIGIVGESGCGKSTFGLSLLGLIRRPGRITRGGILFCGEDLLRKTDKEMESIRGDRVSMIFQDPTTYLNPAMRVGKQISESLLLHTNTNRKAALDQAVEILKSMGIPLPSERAKNYPHQLSGGMCQRVMISMALCCEPELLIADEPTTALDVTIQAQILELIKGIRESRGTAIILITHDLGIVARMCDFVGIMYAGKIVEYADVYTVYDSPRHPYTIGLIHSVPKISVEQESRDSNDRSKKKRFQTISGLPPNLLNLPDNQCSFLPRCTKALEECARKEPPVKYLNSKHWIRCFL